MRKTDVQGEIDNILDGVCKPCSHPLKGEEVDTKYRYCIEKCTHGLRLRDLGQEKLRLTRADRIARGQHVITKNKYKKRTEFSMEIYYELKKLLDEGMYRKDIAVKLDISGGSVSRWIKKGDKIMEEQNNE